MSYTFSRRDFMKYTATAAVAVAGVGLLGGCDADPYNKVAKSMSTKVSVLQVTGTLKSIDLTNGKFEFEAKLSGEATYNVDKNDFFVGVKTKDGTGYEKYSSLEKGINFEKIEPTDGKLNKSSSVKVTVAAASFPNNLDDTDYVYFKYMPDRGRQGYSMAWEISVADINKANQSSND